MSRFIGIARQPTAAFGSFEDVPGRQDKQYEVANEPVTSAGLANAIEALREESADYRKSYGGAAVHGYWIELDGRTIYLDSLQWFDEQFEGPDGFWAAYARHKKAMKAAEDEMDAWAARA